MVKTLHALAALVCAVSLGACNSVSTPSSEITENFSDILPPLGQVSKNFSVGKNGEMQMTLQSLTPRPVVGFIALAVGQPVSGGCSPILGYVVSQAAVGQQYAFGSINKGSYCILVADPNGILTVSAAFSVQFVHP
jgi:hypothetical protein